ncbi:MAG: hypothetical protein KF722_18405 [Nitrospira sp.]|nr:hypothetical protein [Nitrospira sp.]
MLTLDWFGPDVAAFHSFRESGHGGCEARGDVVGAAGEGLHLIEVATGKIQRLTSPDVRAGVGCWFPDSERFLPTLCDSARPRLPDQIVLGGLDGTLKPWSAQAAEELVLAILSVDQASAWSPSLDRFLVSGMGKQDGTGGKIGGFVTIRRVTVATAELSVVVEVPFEKILGVQGRPRSLAWLFPSAAPSAD